MTQTIFGSKNAQKQFKKSFEWLERKYPKCTQAEYKWEKFKKQFDHGKADSSDLASEWHFHMFVLTRWYEWISRLREEAISKERLRLIESCSYKGEIYLCTSCGEKKHVSQFDSLNSGYEGGETVYGDYVSISVRTGTGICKICRKKRIEEAEAAMREYKRKWYQDHKVEISAKQRERRHSNSESDKKWRSSHRDQINQHMRERKKIDPLFKLKCQARTAIYQSFARTGNVKQERCENITGLAVNDLVDYLCGTYEQTYGEKWDGEKPVHIDHIVPLATAKNEQDVKRLCHYSNLRLLTAEDNLKKGAKINFAV